MKQEGLPPYWLYINIKKRGEDTIKRSTKEKQRVHMSNLYAAEVMLLLIINKSIFRKRYFLKIILMECPGYVLTILLNQSFLYYTDQRGVST